MKRVLCLAALVAVALPVAACSDKKEPTPGDPSGGATTIAQPVTPQPEGAAKDLRNVSCTAGADGAWSFKATLENTSDKAAEYTIIVSVVKKEGSTVVGSDEKVVKVEAGKSAEVALDAFAKPEEPAEQLQCIPTTTVKRG